MALSRKNGLRQVERLPLERRAAEMLRDQILSGAFPPGYRLVEVSLAQRLGLSRGTVRAALSELVHEGLVEQVAYTRWAVPELSSEDAHELFTLRSALEGMGARLAAERLVPEGAKRLELAFQTFVEAAVRGSRGRITELDFALHKLIIELSNHRRLQRQYTLIEQQVRRYIACSNALIPAAENIVEMHAPLVTAILQRRGGGAEREARRHNIDEGKVLVAQLRDKAAKGTALKLVRSPTGRPVAPKAND